jgi:Domain of unknown function (DUF1918)
MSLGASGDWITMTKSSEEKSMTPKDKTSGAQIGDWVETRGVSGKPSRRGEIIEMLGHDEHEHYRVRWDERHESILYPADGVIILGPHPKPASR